MGEISREMFYELLEEKTPFTLVDLRKVEDAERLPLRGSFLKKISLPIAGTPASSPEELTELCKEGMQRLSPQLSLDERYVVLCNRGRMAPILSKMLEEKGCSSHSLAGGIAAWKEFYKVSLAIEESGVNVYQIHSALRGCLSYIIVSSKEAVIVDPLRNVLLYVDFLEKAGVTLKAVIDTHAHADHISSARELATLYQVPYYLHPFDAIHPKSLEIASFSFTMLEEGKKISFGETFLEVLHLPGHTIGNCALLGKGFLLSGDVLFLESLPRSDLGGHAHEWALLEYKSLKRVLSLNEGLIVLPGHVTSLDEIQDGGIVGASLKQIKRRNHALEKVERPSQEFLAYVTEKMPPEEPTYLEIKSVNLGLEDVSPEKAAELEGGSNRCALTTEQPAFSH